MRGFYGLGVFVYRFRWAVLAVWAAVLIASAFFAPNLSDRLKGVDHLLCKLGRLVDRHV